MEEAEPLAVEQERPITSVQCEKRGVRDVAAPGGGWERLVEPLGLMESNVDDNLVDGRKERFVCGADLGLRVE